jgi:maltooligosyltrehalose trehalohydrolase
MPLVEVWAPRAKSVALKIANKTLPMESDQWSWWRVDTAEAQHGVDYAFILDGGPPLPDPRSPWQPKGPHGPSRFYDHSRFAWTDDRWSAGPLGGGVIYEMHIGAFTPEGTFDAAIAHLDYLVELGVTHIELMPVAEFPGKSGWGYDGVDLFAPHHIYGGPDGLKRLVNACHNKGIAVLLDVVYNHLGPDGNYLGAYGWYFTDRYKTPWGEAVNFDGRDNDEVRRFFLDNAKMWICDYHMDGLRLDAIHAIIDLTAIHFLEQLAMEFEVLESQLSRHLVLIAESDLNDPKIVRSRNMGGYGLNAQWNDDFRHALWTVLSGENNGYHADFGKIADLAGAISKVFVYANRYSFYRHRRHGRAAFNIPRRRFIAYLQNHDQVGNRAAGDRMNQVLSPGLSKVGAALVLTSPFVPMLFMGEEWGASTPFQYFTDHQDDNLAKAVREGRIKEFAAFGWEPDRIPDPQSPETPRRSKLLWDEQDRQPHAAMLAWHKALIKLRREYPTLTSGDNEPIFTRFSEEQRWLVIGRELLENKVMIAANFARQGQEVPYWERGVWGILLASENETALNQGGVYLPAESVAILKRFA